MAVGNILSACSVLSSVQDTLFHNSVPVQCGREIRRRMYECLDFFTGKKPQTFVIPNQAVRQQANYVWQLAGSVFFGDIPRTAENNSISRMGLLDGPRPMFV